VSGFRLNKTFNARAKQGSSGSASVYHGITGSCGLMKEKSKRPGTAVIQSGRRCSFPSVAVLNLRENQSEDSRGFGADKDLNAALHPRPSVTTCLQPNVSLNHRAPAARNDGSASLFSARDEIQIAEHFAPLRLKILGWRSTMDMASLRNCGGACIQHPAARGEQVRRVRVRRLLSAR